MSDKKRTLNDLNVLDEFLTTTVSTDSDVDIVFCRTLPSVLLQKEIGDIRVIAQRVNPAISPTHCEIRVDIEIEETSTKLEEPTKANSPDITPQILYFYHLEPHLHDQKDYLHHNLLSG